MPAKRRTRRNVEMGFWNSTGFHPIRASRDYDPDVDEGDYASPKRRKAKAKKRNPRKKRIDWRKAVYAGAKGRTNASTSSGLPADPRGWINAKAVKIVRNKRGQAVAVRIKT